MRGSFHALESDQVYDGVVRRSFSSEQTTIMSYSFAPGARFPVHRHPQEQVTLVQSGEVEMTIGERRRVAVRRRLDDRAARGRARDHGRGRRRQHHRGRRAPPRGESMPTRSSTWRAISDERHGSGARADPDPGGRQGPGAADRRGRRLCDRGDLARDGRAAALDPHDPARARRAHDRAEPSLRGRLQRDRRVRGGARRRRREPVTRCATARWSTSMPGPPYRFRAGPEGMSLFGGPSPPDPALYQDLR